MAVANKTIWYGNPVPRDKDGKIEKEALFDRRMKVLAPGDKIPEAILKEEAVVKRMTDDGLITDKIDTATQLKLEQESAETAKAKPAKA